jgi:hypothetical protein
MHSRWKRLKIRGLHKRGPLHPSQCTGASRCISSEIPSPVFFTTTVFLSLLVYFYPLFWNGTIDFGQDGFSSCFQPSSTVLNFIRSFHLCYKCTPSETPPSQEFGTQKLSSPRKNKPILQKCPDIVSHTLVKVNLLG